MTIFVDTSAFYAVLDAALAEHQLARERWAVLLYVVVETTVLVQRRLGMAAVGVFFREMLPAVRVLWVDGNPHEVAVSLLLGAARRRLSLVDCASFAVMRTQGLTTAFAFDRHFTDEGLTVVP